ncbi:hypothetical protein DFJ73DRAFT_764056 [Zopfochytrium polystomum]|nr:hypothetical protein DFJ73DRAFT_764056 [Zopfochytrium polystomum]
MPSTPQMNRGTDSASGLPSPSHKNSSSASTNQRHPGHSRSKSVPSNPNRQPAAPQYHQSAGSGPLSPTDDLGLDLLDPFTESFASGDTMGSVGSFHPTHIINALALPINDDYAALVTALDKEEHMAEYQLSQRQSLLMSPVPPADGGRGDRNTFSPYPVVPAGFDIVPPSPQPTELPGVEKTEAADPATERARVLLKRQQAQQQMYQQLMREQHERQQRLMEQRQGATAGNGGGDSLSSPLDGQTAIGSPRSSASSAPSTNRPASTKSLKTQSSFGTLKDGAAPSSAASPRSENLLHAHLSTPSTSPQPTSTRSLSTDVASSLDSATHYAYVEAAKRNLRTLDALVADKSGWRAEQAHSSGTMVYRRNKKNENTFQTGKGGNIPIYMGVGVIKGFDPVTVLALIRSRVLWDPWYEDGAHIASLDAQTSLSYYSLKPVTRMLAGSRDFAILERIHHDARSNSLKLVVSSIETPLIPPRPDRVRAYLKLNGWVLDPLIHADGSLSTRLTYVLQIDVKGLIPPSVSGVWLARRAVVHTSLAAYLKKFGGSSIPAEPPMGTRSSGFIQFARDALAAAASAAAAVSSATSFGESVGSSSNGFGTPGATPPASRTGSTDRRTSVSTERRTSTSTTGTRRPSAATIDVGGAWRPSASPSEEAPPPAMPPQAAGPRRPSLPGGALLSPQHSASAGNHPHQQLLHPLQPITPNAFARGGSNPQPPPPSPRSMVASPAVLPTSPGGMTVAAGGVDLQRRGTSGSSRRQGKGILKGSSSVGASGQ